MPAQGSHRSVRGHIRPYGSSSNSFASPGLYAVANPSIAIRWLYGNTLMRVQSPSDVARQWCGYSMPRFPSPGSVQVKFPGFLGTIKALRLPAVRPAAFRFLHLAVPREHASFAPAAAAWGSVGPGVRHPVSPSGNSSWKQQDLPSSWGTPIPVCTWSQTPAGRCVPNRLRNACVAPAERTTKAPTTKWLSRLNSMAFGLAAYVSRIGFPPTRKAGFQVLVRLSWAGFHPQGPDKRFLNLLHVGYSSSSKLLGTKTVCCKV